jgi:uncharacterized protein (TIGR02118 family)
MWLVGADCIRPPNPQTGGEKVVKLTVLYGHPTDPGAFEAYYANIHVPLALKIPGLTRVEAAKVLGMPEGSTAPYFYVAELWFADQEQLEAGMGSAEGRATAADLANFATGSTTILMSEITAEQGHV